MSITVKVLLQATSLYVTSGNNFPVQWVTILRVPISFMHAYF